MRTTVVARQLRLGNVSGAPGAVVKMPVERVAQGDENTVAFSANWDTAMLSFDSAAIGANLLAGTSFLVNTNTAANGRIGVLLTAPAGQSLARGSIEIATLSLRIASNAGNTTQATVSFSDQPVPREIVSSNVDVLQATYSGGTVTTTAGFEADLSPRPNGDQRLTAADSTLLARLVAGLSSQSDLSPNEFIRADCAPRATSGDGRITAADSTQAARYVVGLDAPQPAGGPNRSLLGSIGPGNVVRKSVTRLFVGFTVSGTIGKTYRLEYTEQIGSGVWQTAAMIKLTKNPQWWVDTAAPVEGRRFYRAAEVSQP